MKTLRKLKARRGFSMPEMLVAVLILSIMSSVACMGVTTALQDRAKAIVVANAQTVASTAAQMVGDQIRYGQIIQAKDGSIVLVSSTYGERVKLCLDTQGHLVAQGVNAAMNANVGEPCALLGEKAYGGLALDSLKFTADTAADGKTVNSVEISLSVDDEPSTGSGDSEHLWSLTYTVSPLNPYLISGL